MRVRRHVSNPALRGDNGMISNRAMARRADLSGQHDMLAHAGGTGQPNLRAEHGVFSNFRAVPHLHKVVDLNAIGDAGFADGGAVNAGIRLHFDVVADDYRARLHNLVPAFSVGRKAIAVRADHDSILQDDIVADAAELTHRRVRVGKKIIADLRSAVDHNMGQQGELAPISTSSSMTT